MAWRTILTDIYELLPSRAGWTSRPEFRLGTDPPAVAAAEETLGAAFPISLRSLLLESDGVMDQMAVDGGDWFDNDLLVWPTAEIVEQNLHVRAEGMRGTYQRDFRELLFFAGAGADGILFAFPALAPGGTDRRCGPNVLTWHPVENELAEAAPTLEDFLRGWLRGEIAV